MKMQLPAAILASLFAITMSARGQTGPTETAPLNAGRRPF